MDHVEGLSKEECINIEVSNDINSVRTKKELYRKGDMLKAKETVGIYLGSIKVAKNIVYTVSECKGYDVRFEEIPIGNHIWNFERATKNDIKRSVEILKKFIEDKKIKKTVNPFVTYAKYIDEKEIEEHNTSLHTALHESLEL